MNMASASSGQQMAMGVFTVNVMVDGQRIHRVVGRESDGTTRTQAEEFIEKVRSDAKKRSTRTAERAQGRARHA
jgi:hypothetical protein